MSDQLPVGSPQTVVRSKKSQRVTVFDPEETALHSLANDLRRHAPKHPSATPPRSPPVSPLGMSSPTPASLLLHSSELPQHAPMMSLSTSPPQLPPPPRHPQTSPHGLSSTLGATCADVRLPAPTRMLVKDVCPETGDEELFQLSWEGGALVRRKYVPPKVAKRPMTSAELAERLNALVDMGDGSAIVEPRPPALSPAQRTGAIASISTDASQRTIATWRDQPTLDPFTDDEKNLLDSVCEADIVAGPKTLPSCAIHSLSRENVRMLEVDGSAAATLATAVGGSGGGAVLTSTCGHPLAFGHPSPHAMRSSQKAMGEQADFAPANLPQAAISAWLLAQGVLHPAPEPLPNSSPGSATPPS